MSSTETKVAGARGKSVSDREDDDWETDPDYVNTMTEEEQRWGGARDTGVLDMEELRAEVNDLTGASLHARLARLDMENQVGVDQACSDKGEQDFKVAQEAKQVQDKYIGESENVVNPITTPARLTLLRPKHNY